MAAHRHSRYGPTASRLFECPGAHMLEGTAGTCHCYEYRRDVGVTGHTGIAEKSDAGEVDRCVDHSQQWQSMWLLDL
jgi:hypothetical protein